MGVLGVEAVYGPVGDLAIEGNLEVILPPVIVPDPVEFGEYAPDQFKRHSSGKQVHGLVADGDGGKLALDDVEDGTARLVDQCCMAVSWQTQANLLLQDTIVFLVGDLIGVDLELVVKEGQSLECKPFQALRLDGKDGADLAVAQHTGRNLASVGPFRIQPVLKVLKTVQLLLMERHGTLRIDVLAERSLARA
jgi:hypothetical protein